MPRSLRHLLTIAAAPTLAAALVATPALAATRAEPTARPATRPAIQPAERPTAVSSIPVSFKVRNVNRSQVPCASDGRTYTIRGHLVGPARTLRSDRIPLVTSYLHGLSFGQFFWRFTGTKGYNYSANQARNGQVSLVIDRLGYRTSSQPNGFQICAGSRADMAHQVITQLRAGSYGAKGRSHAPRAAKVVLAGHSFGGQIAQIEAYSFGDIDGLIVLAYADRIQSKLLKDNGRYAARVCAQGGIPRKRTYAPFGPVSGAKAALFNSATPQVTRQALKLLTLDPCGDSASFTAATQVDLRRVGSITVPVLVVAGGADKLFPRPAAPNQAKLFTGSRDRTAVVLPNTAHALTFEATHVALANQIDRWLDARFE